MNNFHCPSKMMAKCEYDYDSKLVRKFFANGTKEEYSYDERSRLMGIVLKKSNNDVLSSHQYVYDAVSNIIARDDNGTVTEFTYDLIDQLLSETKQGYSAEYAYDANGNLIDYSGTWSGSFAYGGAFGYQSDGDSGLMLLGHRYYDASTGRFLSRDPVGDGSNWYVYCGNNPIARADLFGLKDAIIVIGGPEYGDPKEDISADIELGEYYKKKYKNLGYRTYLFEQPTAKIVEHRLKTADVFVFIGHGGKDHLHLPATIPPSFQEAEDLQKEHLNRILDARNGKKLELIILEACTSLVKEPEWEFWGKYADTIEAYVGTTWSSARLQYLIEGKVDGRKYPNWKPPKKYNSKKASFTRSLLIAF